MFFAALLAQSLVLAPATTPVKASLDFDRVAREDFVRFELADLYKSLFVRLMQTGAAMVDNPREADLVVSLVRDGDAFRITARRGSESREANVTLADRTVRLIHLEVMHAAETLVSELLAVPQHVVEVEPLPQPPRPQLRWGAGAQGIVVWDTAASWLAGVEGRSWVSDEIAVTLGAATSRLVGGPTHLAVHEDLLTVGLTATHDLGAVALSGHAALGVLRHRYDWAPSSAVADQGARLNPQGVLTLGAAVTPFSMTTVGLELGALVAAHGRKHETPSRTLWACGAVRPLASLSLAFEL